MEVLFCCLCDAGSPCFIPLYICCSICDHYLGKFCLNYANPWRVFSTQNMKIMTVYLKYSWQYIAPSLPSCLRAFTVLEPWLSWIVELCPVSIKGEREAVRYKAPQASTNAERRWEERRCELWVALLNDVFGWGERATRRPAVPVTVNPQTFHYKHLHNAAPLARSLHKIL